MSGYHISEFIVKRSGMNKRKETYRKRIRGGLIIISHQIHHGALIMAKRESEGLSSLSYVFQSKVKIKKR